MKRLNLLEGQPPRRQRFDLWPLAGAALLIVSGVLMIIAIRAWFGWLSAVNDAVAALVAS